MITYNNQLKRLVLEFNQEVYFNVLGYGARGDGVTDDTDAIKAAVAAAGANNGMVYFPNGVYLYSDNILANGITIQGQNRTGTILRATDRTKSSWQLTGNGVSIRSLTIECPSASERSQSFAAAGVYLGEATDFTVQDIRINKVQNAGIVIQNCNTGSVIGNYVEATFADGIHHTGGTTRVNTYGNQVRNTGDDAIAVVSYLSDATICSRINISGNIVGTTPANGRGITVIGGSQVNIANNNVKTTGGAGIAIASEGSYNTYEVDTVNVIGNIISDTDNTVLQGGIFLNGRLNYPVSNINLINNQINDVPYRGIHIADYTLGIICKGNILELIGSFGIIISAATVSRNVNISDNLIKATESGGIVCVATITGALYIKDNILMNINAGGVASEDAIRVHSGVTAGTYILISGNCHQNPAGYTISRMVECNNNGAILMNNISQDGLFVIYPDNPVFQVALPATEPASDISMWQDAEAVKINIQV